MNKKRDVILLISIAIIILTIGFFGIPTGYVILSQPTEVTWGEIPKNIELDKNQHISIKINLLDHKFSDTTKLFNITQKGIISFTPREAGNFRTAIIALDQDENVKVKVIRFNIK